MTVVHVSSFLAGPQRHGGMRRSEQLAQNIARVITNSPVPTLSCARIRRTWRINPTAILRLAPRAFGLFLRGTLSLRGFMRYLAYGPTIMQFLVSQRPTLIALELCPGISMIAGDIVRRSGVPYVVFPHNIEFLVPNARPEATFSSFAGAFEIETLIHRHARQVLTISAFDAKILKCQGIPAEVWPSYPPTQDVDRLGRLRATRQENAFRRTEVLVLGTVINPPTLTGMNSLLTAVRQSRTWKQHINVVGFGTETLDSGGSPRIRVVGEVDNDTLNRLMIDCAFALIHQPPTTGFLTRLVDLNLAGVPVAVIGGYEQAQQLLAHGIFTFETLDAIDPDRMTQAESVPFDPPAIDCLRANLLGDSGMTA